MLDRDACVSNAGEPGGVQLPVLLGKRLDRHRPGRRQLDERLRAIDQLSVQLAVRVARDSTAGDGRRVFRDVPFRERGRIQDVLVAAANDDDGIRRRDAVEILAVRQPMLSELRFVPVAVGDDHVARRCAANLRGDRCEHLRQRSRARQVDAGTAARIVEVIVGQARNHGATAQIDRSGGRSRERADRVVRADG